MLRRTQTILILIGILILTSMACAITPKVAVTLKVNETPVSGFTTESKPAEPVQTQNPTSGGDMIPTIQAPTTQTRGQFELVGGRGHIVNGFLRIPAMVRNRSEYWADVIIGVELFDAAGRPLINRAATSAREQMFSTHAIPPGGLMYYLYLRDVERLSGQYASHQLTLQDAYASAPAGTAQVTLTDQLALKPAFEGAPTYLARGTVTSATGCVSPLVVAGSFDAAGNLLDVAESRVYSGIGVRSFESDLEELAPGATGHFILEFLVPGVQKIQAVVVCR